MDRTGISASVSLQLEKHRSVRAAVTALNKHHCQLHREERSKSLMYQAMPRVAGRKSPRLLMLLPCILPYVAHMVHAYPPWVPTGTRNPPELPAEADISLLEKQCPCHSSLTARSRWHYQKGSLDEAINSLSWKLSLTLQHLTLKLSATLCIWNVSRQLR